MKINLLVIGKGLDMGVFRESRAGLEYPVFYKNRSDVGFGWFGRFLVFAIFATFL